jgi:hypothetical protein
MTEIKHLNPHEEQMTYRGKMSFLSRSTIYFDITFRMGTPYIKNLNLSVRWFMAVWGRNIW